jgi:hypothetical protein
MRTNDSTPTQRELLAGTTKYGPDEAPATVSAGGRHDALLMRNNTGGAEMVTSVGEPARTMTAHVDTQSLLVPYSRTGALRGVSGPWNSFGLWLAT